jgi:hypothetical protein
MIKQLIATFIIILAPAIAVSQNYRPLPGAGAAWQLVTYSIYSPTFNTITYYYLEVPSVSPDTIIQANVYHKLIEHTVNYPAGNFIGGFRSDSTGKTWWFPSGDSTEYLLMDFNVQQGDTVSDVFLINGMGIPSVDDLLVDSTGIQVIDGVMRKKVFVTSPSQSHRYMWLEGIGSFNGFLNKDDIVGLTISFDNYVCISFDDTVRFTGDSIYPEPFDFYSFPDSLQTTSDSCSLIVLTLVGQLEQTQGEILIYPNPASTSLILEPTTNEPQQFRIYTTSGQLVLNQRIQSRSTIDVSHLPEGLYLLELETPQGIVHQKLVLQR